MSASSCSICSTMLTRFCLEARCRKVTTVFLILLLLALMAATPAKQAHAQTISPGASADRLSVDLLHADADVNGQIVLDLLVLDDRGFSVSGLTASDFRVTVDGVEVPIATTTVGRAAKDSRVILAIDVSGSMEGEKFAAAQEAIRDLIANRGSLGEVLLLVFDKEVRVLSNYTSNDALLISLVDRLHIAGATSKYTALYDAVYTSVNSLGAIPGGRKAIILVTDGEDTGSTVLLDDAVRALERAPVRIYVVGYTLGSLGASSVRAEALLRRLAILSDGRYYASPRASDLVNLYQQLAQSLSTNYQLTLAAPEAERDGERHEVAVTASLIAGITGTAYVPILIPSPPRPIPAEGGMSQSMQILIGAVVLGVALILAIAVAFILIRKSQKAT